MNNEESEELYLIPVNNPDEVDKEAVFDHLKIEKESSTNYFIFRFPKPSEFIDQFPDYILIHEEEIGILKKGTETLQIVPNGLYKVNHKIVNPSTNYLVFISMTDFHMEWEAKFVLKNEETGVEDHFHVQGTIIIEPKDIALLAYNLILITRGLQIEFNDWLNEQITGIFLENEEIKELITDSKKSIEKITTILQEGLEKDLNFVGIELKGIQISDLRHNDSFTTHREKAFEASKEEVRSLEANKAIGSSKHTGGKSDGAFKAEENEVIMEINFPPKVVIGVPFEIEVTITPIKKLEQKEAIIVAYSPSFLIISNDKRILLDKKVTVKFQAVPVNQSNPSITINLFNEEGTLISQKMIYDIRIEKGTENTLKYLLKMFGFSGVIIIANYLLALILSPFLGTQENLARVSSFTIGIIIGLLLASIITFTELKRRHSP